MMRVVHSTQHYLREKNRFGGKLDSNIATRSSLQQIHSKILSTGYFTSKLKTFAQVMPHSTPETIHK